MSEQVIDIVGSVEETGSIAPTVSIEGILCKHVIRTPKQMRDTCVDATNVNYLINGLVPVQALALMVGDSGLGKSPLLYQACACVSAGVPFLGRAVKKGRLLYCDCENRGERYVNPSL